jgi:hypothetical protein
VAGRVEEFGGFGADRSEECNEIAQGDLCDNPQGGWRRDTANALVGCAPAQSLRVCTRTDICFAIRPASTLLLTGDDWAAVLENFDTSLDAQVAAAPSKEEQELAAAKALVSPVLPWVLGLGCA